MPEHGDTHGVARSVLGRSQIGAKTPRRSRSVGPYPESGHQSTRSISSAGFVMEANDATQQDRRGFLKAAGVAATSLSLAGLPSAARGVSQAIGKMKIENVGVMSSGHMGQAVAIQIKAKGLHVYTALEHRSERTRGLAREAGLTDVGTLARTRCRMRCRTFDHGSGRRGRFRTGSLGCHPHERPADTDCRLQCDRAADRVRNRKLGRASGRAFSRRRHHRVATTWQSAYRCRKWCRMRQTI